MGRDNRPGLIVKKAAPPTGRKLPPSPWGALSSSSSLNSARLINVEVESGLRDAFRLAFSANLVFFVAYPATQREE